MQLIVVTATSVHPPQNLAELLVSLNMILPIAAQQMVSVHNSVRTIKVSGRAQPCKEIDD